MESAEHFIEVLSGDNIDEQRGLLAYLSGHADLISDQLVPVLVNLLGSERKELSRCCASALALGLRRGVGRQSLTAALKDDNRSRRFAAAFACHEGGVFDEAGFDVCLSALGDGSSDTRWAASSLIVDQAHVFDSDFVKLRALLDSNNVEQRRMTFYTLRELGVWNCREFVSGLIDPIAAVRIAALAAVIRNRPQVGSNQQSDRRFQQHKQRDGLKQSDEDESGIDEALVRILRDDCVVEVRRVAATALAKSGCLSREAHKALLLATLDVDVTLARLAQRILQDSGLGEEQHSGNAQPRGDRERGGEHD